MRLESEVADDLEYFFHLSFGGVGSHYNEHKDISKQLIKLLI
jgi:hypothetical protein